MSFFAKGLRFREKPSVTHFAQYPEYSQRILDYLDDRDFKSVTGTFKENGLIDVQDLTRAVKLEYTSAGQFSADYWEHADPKHFPKIEKKLETLFLEYLEAKKKNNKAEAEDKIAKIRWWMANAMFHGIKSPEVIEQVTRALEKEAAIKAKIWKDKIDPIAEAFMSSEYDYAEAYSSGDYFK